MEGSGCSFSVEATGTAPLFCQWYFNGTELVGATNWVYGIAAVSFSHAGAYHAVVSNAVGTATSQVAILVVRSTNDPVYAPPQGGWAYVYHGDAVASAGHAALDGTWDHNNTSDSWDGLGRGPGVGLPGGLSSTNGVLTIEDAVDSTVVAPDNNRRFYLTHDLDRAGVPNARMILNEGLTLSFRARLTPETDPWLELATAPNGWINGPDGRGMIGVRQAGTNSMLAGMIISFSLHRAIEDLNPGSNFVFGVAGLHMNNLHGDLRSSLVDPGEGGTLNVLPLDPTVFHEFWITIQDNGPDPGTHRVEVYVDGSRTPAVFNVTAGTGYDVISTTPATTNYLALGLPVAAQVGALDLDFLAYRPGVIRPAGFNDPVGLSLQPTNQTVALGQTASFSCAVTGTPPWFVQWYRASQPIPGATNLSYSIGPVTEPDVGVPLVVVVTNWFSAATSAPVFIQLMGPPVILSQPLSLTVTNGDTARFSVTAGGAGLTYQWQFNEAPIPNATDSTLTIDPVTPAHAGTYQVQVANASGTVTSAPASLVVLTFDWGDAPPPFPTLRAAQGAGHLIVPGIHLGPTVDWETDGQPSANAMGDDLAGETDEDGVRFITPLLVGQVAQVEVVASTNGLLNAWLDFHRNGSWAEPADHIFTNHLVAPGTNQLSFRIPVEAAAGASFARFRFSTTAGLSWTGLAPDGEVEDYHVMVQPAADLAVGGRATPEPVARGSNLIVQVSVTNLGPSAAVETILRFALPPQISLVSATASQGRCSLTNGSVRCELGTLVAAATAQVTLSLQPAASGLMELSVQVAGTVPDPVPANNQAAIPVSVLDPPTILTPPASLTVPKGDPAWFSVVATGTLPLFYQWFFEGAVLAEATNSTLQIPNAQPSHAGRYSVRVTNAVGAVVSAPATLAVVVPPSIVVQPQSQTNLAGRSVVFSVVATGTEPFQYQWFFNGAELTGATNWQLRLDPLASTQAGLYTVRVANVAGATLSQPATLVVLELDFGDAPDPPYPSLLARDGARHRVVAGVFLGSRLDFEPEAWSNAQANGDDQLGEADEDGVWLPNPVLLGRTNGLWVVASTNGFLNGWLDFNQNGSWAELADQLFVNQPLVAGTNALVFVAPATGVPGLSFARFRFSTAGNLSWTGEAPDGEVEDHRVSLAEAVDLGLSLASQPDATPTGTNFTYTLHLTNRGPCPARALTLSNWWPAGVTLLTAASGQGSCTWVGSTLSCLFSNLAPGTAATVAVSAVGTAPGRFTNYATVASGAVELEPQDNAVQALTVVQDYPRILVQPQSQVVTQGQTVRLAVEAAGTELAYQWQLEERDLPGATAPELTLPSVDLTHAGRYRVRAANLVGAVWSQVATLVVLVPPQIVVQPQSQVVTQGQAVLLRVVAAGTEPLSYQWSFGNLELPGATQAEFRIASASVADAGQYVVRVRNQAGSILSEPAVLVVLVPPAIVVQPQSQTNFVGAEVVLSVSAEGTAPLAYQWYFNGTEVVGATHSQLRILNASLTDSGLYAVRVSNAVGSVWSQPATLVIIEADWGDAPEPYPTLSLYRGAWHRLVPGVHLGREIDSEINGQPHPEARGDDLAGLADEDGVSFVSPLRPGQNAVVVVVASTNGYLDAWIDFDADGFWFGSGERIFSRQPLSPGPNLLSFPLPTGARLGATFARFRFSTSGGLDYDGGAADGEVEDYQVSVEAAADLAVGYVEPAEAVALGSLVVCTVAVTNRGPADSSGLMLTNWLAGGLQVVSVTTSRGACSVAAGRVECSLGSLAAGASAQVTLTLRADQTGRFTNRVAVAGQTHDPELANNQAEHRMVVFAPSPIFANSTPIIVPEQGPAALYPSTIQASGLTATVWRVSVTLHRLTHSYPGDLDILLVGPQGQSALLMSDAGGGYAVSAVTITLDDAGPNRLLPSGRIFSQSYFPTNFDGLDPDRFQPPAPAPPYGSGLGIFRGTDPNGLWRLYVMDDTPEDSGIIEGGWSLGFGLLDPMADLGLVLQAPEPAVVGIDLAYSLTVTNAGPGNAAEVMVTAPLAGTVQFVSATPSQGACAVQDGALRCALGSLAAGTTATVSLVVRPLVAGLLTNTATVSAATVDLNPSNDTASVRTTVVNPVDLAVWVEAEPQPAVVGAPLTYRLVVTNHLPHQAAEVWLTNDLPANFAGLSVIPSQGSCMVQPGRVICSVGTVQPGVDARVTVVGTPLRPGLLSNVVWVTGSGPEIAPADNTQGHLLNAVNVAGPFVGHGPLTIPGPGPATPYPSVLEVFGLTGAVYGVSVTLSNLDHPVPAHLAAVLVGPMGQGVWLMAHVGAGGPAQAVTLQLEDQAAEALPEAAPLRSGRFKPTAYEPVPSALAPPAPEGPYATGLGAFIGTDPNGPWSLFVMDMGNSGGGVLGGWSLRLETGEPIADLAAGIGVNPGLVATGSVVTFQLGLTNLGPADATAVALAAPLPVGVELVSATASQGRCQMVNGRLECSLGNLRCGAGAEVTLRLRPLAAGTLTQTMSVSALELDVRPANNAASARVEVEEPPVIVGQPQNLQLLKGSTALWAVEVAGTPPLSYQWYFGDAELAGATNAQYRIDNLQLRHTGPYRVQVSNRVGSVSSQPATLRVLSRPWLQAPASQWLLEDTSSGPLPFVIGDEDTPVDQLTVTAWCTAPGLVPPQNLILGGTGAQRTIEVRPGPEQAGMAFIVLRVTDPDGLSAQEAFSVWVTPVNDPPTIEPVADQQMAEDTVWVVPVVVGDVETPASALQLQATASNPALLPQSGLIWGGQASNRTLTLQPNPNAFGTSWVTVTVTDSDGGSTSLSFLVTVAAVNDPPSLSLIPDQTLWEDSLSDLIPFTVSDVETPPEQLTVTASSSDAAVLPAENIVVRGSGAHRTLQLVPKPDAWGTVVVTVTVSDLDGGQTSTQFRLHVLGINDPPSLAPIPDQSTPEDTPRLIACTVTDPDHTPESLRVMATSANPLLVPPENLHIGGAGSNWTLTVVPALNQFGLAPITVTVTDPEGASVSTTFVLMVEPENDPPSIWPMADVVLDEGSWTGPIAFTVADVESPASILVVEGFSTDAALLPESALVVGGGGSQRTLTIRPTPGRSGTATVTVVVRDPDGGSATCSFGVTVRPVNAAPSLNALPDVTLAANSTVQLPVAVTDRETPAEALILTAVSSNPAVLDQAGLHWGGQGAQRTLRLQPRPDAAGTATVTVTVTDAQGASASRRFEVTVLPGSEPPRILASPQSQTLNPGTTATLRVEATGTPPLWYQWLFGPMPLLAYWAGGQAWEPELQPLPGATNAVLAIGPVGLHHAGLYAVRVTNAFGVAQSAPALLTVAVPSSVPSVSAVPDQATDEDTPLVLSVSVGSATLPPERLHLSAASTNTALVPSQNIVISGFGSNRTVRIVPAPDAFGLTRITLTVTDGVGSNSTSFLLTVNPVNDPPTLAPIPDTAYKTGSGDKNVAVTGISSGATNENQALTLTATSSDPALVTIRSVTYTSPATSGVVKLKFGASTGVATVTVTVHDGGASNAVFSRSFAVGVFAAANSAAPSISAIPPQVTDEDVPTPPIPFTVGDSGTPATQLVVSARSSNPALVPPDTILLGGSGSNRTVTVRPAPDAWGTAIITLTVSDGALGFNGTNFVLTVRPVNDPPALEPILDQTVLEDQWLGPVLVRVRDVDTPLSAVTVVASAANPDLVPPTGLVLVGQGAERALWIRPASNAVGTTTITLTAHDDAAASQRPFQLTVQPANDPPGISSIQDQTVAAGTVGLLIPFNVWDAETPAEQLVVSVRSSNPVLLPPESLELAGSDRQRTLRVQPPLGADGTAVLTLTVTDAEGATASTSFRMVVVHVNVPPTLGPIPDIILDEDAGLQTIPLTGLSAGGAGELQVLALTARSSNPGLIPHPVCTITNLGDGSWAGTLSLEPTPSSNGTAVITVTVNDGQATNHLFWRSFTVTVNGAPRFSPIPDQTTLEDQPLTVRFRVEDPETPVEALLLSVQWSNPALIAAADWSWAGSGPERLLRLRPQPDAFGFSFVTITATDSRGLSRSCRFGLTTQPVNDPPTIDPLPDVVLRRNAGVEIVPLTGLSAGPTNEHQQLTLTARSSNPALIPDPEVVYQPPASIGWLRLRPRTNATGLATITVTVSDGHSHQGRTTASFSVQVLALNNPPWLWGLTDQVTDEDVPVGPLHFTVADDATPAEALVVTAWSSDTNLVPQTGLVLGGAGAQRTLTIHPATNAWAWDPVAITVEVADAEGAVTRASFNLTVRFVNDPPYLLAPGDQSIWEDTTLGPIWFQAWDCDLHEFSVTARSSNTNLVADTGLVLLAGLGMDWVLWAQPLPDVSGSTLITLRVTDVFGVTVEESFELRVLPVNDPPRLDALADVNLPVNAAPLTIPLTGLSPGPPDETQRLSLTAVCTDPGLLSALTVAYTNPAPIGWLTLQPASNAVGQAQVTVVVEDDGGTERGGTNRFSRSFKVTVGQMPQPLLWITRTTDGVVLSFQTVPGASYSLQYADALAPTAWATLATYSGSGLTQTVLDSVRPGTTRFYRLVQR